MPYIELKTTRKIDVPTETALRCALGDAISLIEGKSERWLMISFLDSLKMAFAGSDEPCAMISVDIFGSADDDEYDALTARLTEVASAALSIPPTRIYVKYTEVEHWGFAGENF